MNFDSVLQWLTFLGVVGLGLYFRSYLKKKAENLATKEDVSEITKQVESMKATVGAQLYIHQVRYQNEFNILMDLTEKLVELRDSALVLRPVVDYVDASEAEEDRKRKRLKRYQEAALAFYKLYETRKPFYPDEIYNGIKELDRVVWKEVVQYKNRLPSEGKGFDSEYWQKAENNSEEISKLADKVIGLIRNRIRYWEEFKIKT
jgi:hypothetical protein